MKTPKLNKNTKQELFLIGGGGHCSSCIDVIESSKKYIIKGIIDTKISSKESISGYSYIGTDSEFLNYKISNKNILITIGQILNPLLRKNLYFEYINYGAKCPTISSPFSIISKSSKVMGGTIIMHGAIVNSNTLIGENCIINTRAVIEHDVKVGSHTHVSTGVIINGGSEIGSSTFIGSGSTIFEKIKIGNNCVISAGSIIRKDIKDNTFLKLE